MSNYGQHQLIQEPTHILTSYNSETVKAVTLAFCSIQQHYIRNVC